MYDRGDHGLLKALRAGQDAPGALDVGRMVTLKHPEDYHAWFRWTKASVSDRT